TRVPLSVAGSGSKRSGTDGREMVGGASCGCDARAGADAAGAGDSGAAASRPDDSVASAPKAMRETVYRGTARGCADIGPARRNQHERRQVAAFARLAP